MRWCLWERRAGRVRGGRCRRLDGALGGAASGGAGARGCYQVKGGGCGQKRGSSGSGPLPPLLSPHSTSSTSSHLILILGGQVRREAVPWPGCGPGTGFLRTEMVTQRGPGTRCPWRASVSAQLFPSGQPSGEGLCPLVCSCKIIGPFHAVVCRALSAPPAHVSTQ